ncbi:effector protein Tle3 domain-containing protein [Pseudomonas quasicaspiana]|uniref:effector protein Tle3 domain-containing protein n=1 Tax=Pseudomonas quasicaspiana TaxID=2829821 RepID=UPI0026D29F26
MNSLPGNLPDDPVLLKQMLGQMLDERQLDKGKIVRLEEQNALLLQRLFGRKSEQTADAETPQLALFNQVESVVEPVDEASDEEVAAPIKRRGKRKPLPADLPRIEIIHERPEHEVTCVCGCRKHAIGEEVSKQLQIVPMQIRAIKHVRKVYGCRVCEVAPVTAGKPAQLIEKSMASPSVLAMLLTNKYVDGLPLSLSSPENHRRVTAMDIAIGQAKCIDHPALRDVLVAIADWKIDVEKFSAISELSGWKQLNEEAQELVLASYLYYQEREFLSHELVPLTPPPLARNTQNPGGVK